MSRYTTRLACVLLTVAMSAGSAVAQDVATTQRSAIAAPAATPQPGPPPTLGSVAYGKNPRQVLDLWKARSARPTPVVIHMHGGAWVQGNRGAVPAIDKYLAAGISVVSISYRYTSQAQAAGVMPPVEWPMHDAAQALQFVRSKAAEWHLDKQRIAFTGASAGACTSLWLAFHDDMADPRSADLVARESTRLWCVAVDSAQTSLDPQQMRDWTPNSRYGGHAFGFKVPKDVKALEAQFELFLAHRNDLLAWIKAYSPMEQATLDDPPVYLLYKTPPALGQPQKDPTHTANFGVKLKEKLDSIGVQCELVYPGAPGVTHPTMEDYLIERLISH